MTGIFVRGAEKLRQPSQEEAATTTVLRQSTQPMERMRLVTALAVIARRNGRELPSEILPQFSLGKCDGHGVCDKVCPTAALRRIETEAEARMEFHAARCIACGLCARSCPEKAIRIQAEGGKAAFEVVARWQARTCATCGRTHYQGGGDVCPACQKDRQLLQGVAALFGLRVS